jgi:uncharacterized membrane protein YheB (UPF0754 family)
MVEVVVASTVVCALVGWGTNVLAVRMLFRPYRPWRVGPWVLQGVFPRRQAAVARRLGELTATELLPPQRLQQAVAAPATVKAVQQALVAALTQRVSRLVHGVPSVLGPFQKRLLATFEDAVDAELDRSLPGLMERVAGAAAQELRVAQVVEEQVAALPPERLEEMLLSVLRRELRFVEGAGALLGAFVGMVQGILWIMIEK